MKNLKPSVTKLIKQLDKPALMKWANKIGLEGTSLDDFYKESRSKGLSLHNQIERYFNDGTMFEDQKAQENFDRFMWDVEFISVEEDVECEYFQGRLDLKCTKGGEKFILDFKSSKGIYFEQELQLAAYQMCNPEYKIGIVKIPEFTFTEVKIDPYKYRNILIHLSELYKFIQS